MPPQPSSTSKINIPRRHVLTLFVLAFAVIGYLALHNGHAAPSPSTRLPGATATYVVGHDTTTANYTDLQVALNALPASGGTIFIQSGTYTVSGSISIPTSKVTIEGEGSSTILACSVGSGAACLKPAQAGLSQIVIRDVTLSQTGSLTQGIGIDTSDISNVRVENVRLENFGTGLSIFDHNSDSFYSSYRDLIIFDCKNGISIGGSQANNNVFEAVRIRPKAGLGGIGVSITDARGLTFTNLDVEPAAGQGAGLTGVVIDATSRELVFVNPWIENNGTGINIHKGARRITVIGGSLTSNGTDIIDQGTDDSFVSTSRTGTTLNYGPPNIHVQ